MTALYLSHLAHGIGNVRTKTAPALACELWLKIKGFLQFGHWKAASLLVFNVRPTRRPLRVKSGKNTRQKALMAKLAHRIARVIPGFK
ncbi:hypothetical protein JOE51_004906 [Bradyrhizobium japonicum]|uniref:hypothetical protein n=1 Tax=Bradyrhizobium diazoefficiens TaxID=1355477 RepID=UPI00160299B9|nr:hypothetical protein [Bradyrhizobium diazoefficiens]MBP1063439.1 hypothetical protein [Bradyrhizobium japonicum]